jgi:hypothetical protein
MCLQVQEAVNEEGIDVEKTQVRQSLSSEGNFEFLNDDWFWATDLKYSRNRLHNVTRKILSIASPQNVLTIRDGIRRAYRWRALSQVPIQNTDSSTNSSC